MNWAIVAFEGGNPLRLDDGIDGLTKDAVNTDRKDEVKTEVMERTSNGRRK
jgi:hypothetical protein